MAPQYIAVAQPYSGPGANTLVAHSQQMEQLQRQNNPFTYPVYNNGSNGIAPVFPVNYIRSRPQHPTEMQQNAYTPRSMHQGYLDTRYHQQSQSPPLKIEPLPAIARSPIHEPGNVKTINPILQGTGSSQDFKTEVDTLMKAIQAKVEVAKQPSDAEARRSSGRSRAKATKKKHKCTFENCDQVFGQKTHLDIHARCHTGEKPYACPWPNCHHTFSQHGNMKTHLRRHSGEKPYPCAECGRTFAQKGNVAAHQAIHTQAKPFLCLLDNCKKKFTQRGNLKSHMNKFHKPSLLAYTTKFASYQPGDYVSETDREMWKYFADMYKNSNKGIKGRGKDRKVSSSSDRLVARMRDLKVMHNESVRYNGGHMNNMAYDMYAVDSRSNSASCQSSQTGGSPCYTTCDSFEDTGKAGLTFGESMY
ncbi:hypothetical protein BP6252_01343 [Coleophoma cylindrospora]|uniref:C2H2-type domain-containing protein n=1 Tax=Coleophoma cylindrospora TaxID=1849047 RepID=A0A3D8ST19_9HELO|nr:hypothetical protein BP6252_01343 [Coleophoma cylindrospora]